MGADLRFPSVIAPEPRIGAQLRHGFSHLAGTAAGVAAVSVLICSLLAACSAVPSPSGTRPAVSTTTTGPSLPVATESAGPTTAASVGPHSSPAWASFAWAEADPEPFSGPGNQFIMGGTAWSGGFVLVGENYDVPSGTSDGAVWSSTDGLRWQLIPNTGGTFSGSEITAVAARGSTLVAVGISRSEDQAQGTQPPGLLWTSSDGIHWLRETGTDSIVSQVSPDGVVAGPGGFIAYGVDLTGKSQQILCSSDGIAWHRFADTDGVFSGGTVRSITTAGNGFAAVGYSASLRVVPTGVFDPTPPPAAAWWSADGQSWHASDVGSGGYDLGTVEPWLGGTLRALGRGACGGCIGPPVVWDSSDGGQTWQQDPRNLGVTYYWSLVMGDRAVEMDRPLAATWSADGRSWHLLPMTGVTLPSDAYPQIARGQTVLVTDSVNPPGGLANDQADSRVYVGTLR